MFSVLDELSGFAPVFLGIFIEAAAFLMLGSVASGLVEAFVQPADLARWLPKNRFFATVAGALMGLVFPVCECGVVPLVRRLLRKGLPLPAGIAFLLAAPVFNPIVILSTFAAFGDTPVFWGRIILSVSIAVLTGSVFMLNRNAAAVLRAPEPALRMGGASAATLGWARALQVAVDEFFDMGRYLVVGAGLAALLQTFVAQNVLLGIGSGPVVSVAVMIGLAVLLSVCSTVDSFIALAFAGSFTTGSILAFLVFGPMVDIKSSLMFMGVFKRKTVVYLILLPLLMTVLAAVFINLNTTW
jgi:hypothetical protein